MPEPSWQAAQDRALLVEAARAAGPVAMAHFGRSLKTQEKPDGQGPVSEADFAVNDVLRAYLRPARPGYGWRSEEDADDGSRLDAARHFLIDPIDGTRAYLAGQEGFSIALAVVERGEVIAAAVHLPAREETFAAHLGGGASLDGGPIRVSARAALEGAQAVAAKSQFQPGHWPGGVPAVTSRFRPSLAWRLCLVASGAFDLTLTFRPAWEWDIASGALIAAEAGAHVTDADGAALVFGSPSAQVPGVMIAPPGLHRQLMAHRRAG